MSESDPVVVAGPRANATMPAVELVRPNQVSVHVEGETGVLEVEHRVGELGQQMVVHQHHLDAAQGDGVVVALLVVASLRHLPASIFRSARMRLNSSFA